MMLVIQQEHLIPSFKITPLRPFLLSLKLDYLMRVDLRRNFTIRFSFIDLKHYMGMTLSSLSVETYEARTFLD